MDLDGTTVSLPGVAVLGMVVGFASGMFGVGGGFLLTPLLAVVFDVPLPLAVGTGLCQMIGTSTVAALRHRKLKQGEPRFALLLVAGSLIGVTAGARVVTALASVGHWHVFGKSIPAATLGLYCAYAVFLAVIGAVMWRQATGDYDELTYVRRGPLARLRVPPFVDLPDVPLRRVSATVIAYVGLLLGFLSGLLGVGGGIALIPILLYGFGFTFRKAAGTGVEVTLVMATAGTLAHARAGNVHLGLAFTLLIGSGISAQLGAIATSRVPTRVLRKGLAGAIFVTIAAIVFDVVRRFS